MFLYVPNPEPGIRYFWSTGDSSSSIVVKQTGLYSLDSISNAVGCGIKVGDTVAVNIKNAVIPAVPVISSPALVEICQGALAKLTIDNVQLTIEYRWSNGALGDSVLVNSGQYSVISESSEGCQSGSSDTVRVIAYPFPKPVFVNLDSVINRETLLNQNYCVSGLPGSRFLFTVQNGIIIDSSEDCITVNWAVPPPSGVGGLSVIEIRKEANCQGTTSQVIRYRPSLTIPNLITPNNDGKNDGFVIQDLEFYSNHRLQIFNRWGKKVLDSLSYNNDWKGDEGIYFYHLTVDGKQMSGWVQVVQ